MKIGAFAPVLTLALAFASAAHLNAQVGAAPELPLGISTIPLYEPPVSNAADQPTLTVFTPQPGHATGSAIIIAPGGAYLGLAGILEGREVADWFTARGFVAFVLKYRLGAQNPFPIPLLDMQRAIRLVRSFDKRYDLVPNRIGVIGFSAGGHLAASAATLFDNPAPNSTDPVDQLSARPDFAILAYPWLNAMEPQQAKEITYCSVLPAIDRALCAKFATEYTPKLHVSSRTPPTFIFSTTDDSTVPFRASVEFYSAMLAVGAPVEMHLFRHGNHGAGLGSGDAALDLWPILMEQWLRDQGLLKQDPAVAVRAAILTGVPPRKPGKHLTLDSRVSDILADKASVQTVNAVCGPDFLSSLPKTAQGYSLKFLSQYSPKQLTEENLRAIATAFTTPLSSEE
jgi:acetyl esterase/lipase